jgi:hypothetical protein
MKVSEIIGNTIFHDTAPDYYSELFAEEKRNGKLKKSFLMVAGSAVQNLADLDAHQQYNGC